jgi:hypothetical protein
MALWKRAATDRFDVRFGSKADMCSAQAHVRFTPDSDRKSGPPQTVMSALPRIATSNATHGDVCFGPIADMPGLFDQLIGANEQRQWQFDPNGLGGLRIDK